MTFTAFDGERIVARGDAPAIARALEGGVAGQVLVLHDATGAAVDDFAVERDGETTTSAGRESGEVGQRRGRPRLGVVAREVTLLPRHWDWLATQPGGASAALRRLVDQARKDSADLDLRRTRQEAAYRAATTLAGDRAGYEEAMRALFAGDRAAFERLIAPWPPDIAAYLLEAF